MSYSPRACVVKGSVVAELRWMHGLLIIVPSQRVGLSIVGHPIRT
jgi:hypothetical protein